MRFDHPQRRWDRLHDECAPKALASILALRGFYIKVGLPCRAPPLLVLSGHAASLTPY